MNRAAVSASVEYRQLEGLSRFLPSLFWVKPEYTILIYIVIIPMRHLTPTPSWFPRRGNQEGVGVERRYGAFFFMMRVHIREGAV